MNSCRVEMNVEKIQSLIKAICMFDRNNDVARLQGGAIAAAASDKQFCVSRLSQRSPP